MADHIDNALQILEHITIPKSQDTKSFCIEKPRSLAVAYKFSRRIMLTAIEFDNEPAFVTGKIGDESSYRHLSTEMPAFRLEHTQLIPELLLCIGYIAAQMTREVIGHCPDPHP